MIELKTLKDIKEDIDSEQWEFDSAWSPGAYRALELLKQEAIKWIKELKETDEFSEDEQGIFDNNYNVQEWIKHFFNITEEDLKDK